MKRRDARLGPLSRFLSALAIAFFLIPGCGGEAEHAGHDHAEVAAPVADEHEHGPECEHDQAMESAEEHATDDVDEHDHSEAGAHECVAMDPMTAANLGIRVAPVHPKIHYDRLKIPGIVAVVPDRRVAVATPSQVRILSLAAPPHATVHAGEPLAELELVDPEIRDLQMRAVELRAELLAIQTERDRKNTYLAALRPRAAEVGDEFRRVEVDLAVLEARLQSQRSALGATLSYLQVAGLDAEQLAALESHGMVTTRILVSAPALPGAPDLEVAVRYVERGEIVEAGSRLYELVALDQLQVIGEAFETDLPAVQRALAEELPVTLLFPAEQRTVTNLRIQSSEGALDGINRVTHFIVPFENRLLSQSETDGNRYLTWENRAGARVQVLVATQEVGRRFVIPACALVREGGQASVFRKEGDNYERVEVRVEAIEGRSAIVPMDGTLRAGDEIVVIGALQVSLDLQRNAGGAAAADPHAGHNH